MNIIKTEPADDVVPRPPPARRNLSMHDDSVDYFQDSGADATLTGLLPTADSPSSLSRAYSDRESQEGVQLVRTAMKRSKERQVSEEKGVRYSEVTSCSSAPSIKLNMPRSLALKLDYQEILDAWSDKGSLYIVASEDGDRCPQIVPDSHADHFLATASVYNNFTVVKESVGNLWSVPDKGFNVSSLMKMDEDGGKAGQREASVLRYKEKRQNRLFSKRIRYEVRKLNAEKRPRMKGRFVKRN